MQEALLPDPADELLAELTQWLLTEVVPVARSQANWKAMIFGKGTCDWSYVVEKHGGRRRFRVEQGS
jgi:hypothetical protein